MKNKNITQSRKIISRRTFVNRAAAGTAFVALSPATKLFAGDIQQVVSWPADAPNYKFHMIGHSHIDPVWLWPWSEGNGLQKTILI
jgi:hypothetical protein